MNRGARGVLCAFLLAGSACGDGEGGGESGDERVCHDGLRLSVVAAVQGTLVTHIAVVGDEEIAVGVPRLENAARFYSSLWAPDGESIALGYSYWSADAKSGILDPSCEPYTATAVDGSVVAWSPDGQRLLLARLVEEDGRERLAFAAVSVRLGTVGEPLELGSADIGEAGDTDGFELAGGWSADSRFVAIVVMTEEEILNDTPGHLYLVDADAAAPAGIELGAIRDQRSFAWSPADSSLVFADDDAGILVADAATGDVDRIDQTWRACSFEDGGGPFRWAPGGGAFVYPATMSESCGELRLVRLDTDVPYFTASVADSSSYAAPVWYQDSRHIAHLSSDNQSLIWTDLETSSSTPVATTEGTGLIAGFALAASGNRIAVLRLTESWDVLVADIVDGSAGGAAEVASVPELLPSADAIQWSPDGGHLVITGRPGVHIGFPGGVASELEASVVRWSPDSRYLATIDLERLVVRAADGTGLADSRVVVDDAVELDWAP